MPVAPDPPPGLTAGESPDPVVELLVSSRDRGIPLPGGGTALPIAGARPGAAAGPPTPPGAPGMAAGGTERPIGLPAGDCDGARVSPEGGGALTPGGGAGDRI